MSILERINGHSDLVALDDAQRVQLCKEIRAFLIAHIAKTGGHLASNLGVVELTVALETVFDTDVDRLVFDVGHQSYVHKMLTGRQAGFDRLRQFGGIAGFPKPSESDADAFVAGHASSSVSIALGMARARTLQNKNYDVVAVIGDGAATGGMAYEGLNDAAVSKEPMIVILNDNEMSIDQNVGGLARHLSRVRTRDRYLGMKARYRKVLGKLPGGNGIYRFTRACKDRVKRLFLRTTIFENMGFTYLGPVNGHDLPELIRILRAAKRLASPVLIHVQTKKGYGYAPAENDPSKFHGVGVFEPESGATMKSGKSTFSDAFGETLTRLAQEDPRICAITAAMPAGTGLLKFRQNHPDRLFDVGIAEEHAVSMAGGLSKQGMIPVVAIYSTFLQRAYDQILQDVALLNLHTVFAVDRAGLVGEDGETHHGVFDVGYLSHIPGLTLLAPASCAELADMLQWAVKEQTGPVAIRYPRGGDGMYTPSDWKNGNVVCHRNGSDMTLITYGTIITQVLDAAETLHAHGISAKVLRLTKLNSLQTDELTAQIAGKHVFVVEETMHSCAVSADLARLLPQKWVEAIDLGERFITHGKVAELYRAYGLDGDGITARVLEVLKNEN